jgi:hypothetical protein
MLYLSFRIRNKSHITEQGLTKPPQRVFLLPPIPKIRHIHMCVCRYIYHQRSIHHLETQERRSNFRLKRVAGSDLAERGIFSLLFFTRQAMQGWMRRVTFYTMQPRAVKCTRQCSRKGRDYNCICMFTFHLNISSTAVYVCACVGINTDCS